MILDNIGKLVESIEYKSQLIGRKERLDSLEQKLEESHGEFSQNYGKSIGRDIGILYGVVLALLVVIILMKFHII